MATRKFTRSDIVALFDAKWRPGYEDAHFTVEVEGVILLDGIAPPTWILTYSIKYSEEEVGHSNQIVLFQRYNKRAKQYSLSYPSEVKLPMGCTSVKEENAAIQAEQEEESRRYLAMPAT